MRVGNFKKSEKSAKRRSVTAEGMGGTASPPGRGRGTALEHFQNLALTTARAVFSEII